MKIDNLTNQQAVDLFYKLNKDDKNQKTKEELLEEDIFNDSSAIKFTPKKVN